MNMTFLWTITFLHGGQMVVSTYQGHWPVAVMMLGFTIADLGILWVSS